MNIIRVIGLFITLIIISLNQGCATRSEVSKGGVWASISVVKATYTVEQLEQLQIYFALVNNSQKTIDPKVDSWRLVINGNEHPDSQFMFLNGPRDDRWKSLPASEQITFAPAIGYLFKKPGTYTVIWRGDGFRSEPMMFRVIKQKEQFANQQVDPTVKTPGE